MNIAKIASININGISAHTRVGMLTDFIRSHELDIVFLQEVINPEIFNITGYTTHLNIGTIMPGTAIIARHDFPITNIATVPSGRAIAADCTGIRLVNVYAPSGTTRRVERERFFISELPELFYAASRSMLIGGDFNCVLQPADTTGPFTTSRALSEIIRGLALVDTWNQDPLRPTSTHHFPTGATRIDRFFCPKNYWCAKLVFKSFPPHS